MPYCTACLGKGLLSCELLVIPTAAAAAAAAAGILLDVHKTPTPTQRNIPHLPVKETKSARLERAPKYLSLVMFVYQLIESGERKHAGVGV